MSGKSGPTEPEKWADKTGFKTKDGEIIWTCAGKQEKETPRLTPAV